MKRLLLAVSELSTVTASSRSMASDVAAQLTATDGMISLLPYGLKVGDACNPYVDYNCEASKVAIKAAKKAAAKSGECDPYLNFKCLDAYLGDDFVDAFLSLLPA
jgi:hypothetical protein